MFEEGFRARLILGETTGKDRLFVAFFLAFIAFVVYAKSLPGVFIQDDLMIVRDNIFVRDFDLLGMLRSDYWGAGLNPGLYRPMTLVSLAVNRLILGQNPLGYHLVNILLHAGVVVAIWYLLVQWGVKGSVAALLFAVHPIHTEVVDVIVGRSELLAALFLLLAFICAGREGGAVGLLSSFTPRPSCPRSMRSHSRQKNDPIVVAALVMDLAEIYLGLQEPATALRYLDGVGGDLWRRSCFGTA